MKKEISPKIISLAFGVLVIVLVVGFWVFAWTEPTQAPPEGNVPALLNVGPVVQSKVAGLILNTAGDADSNALIIAKGKICLGGVCIDEWPTKTILLEDPKIWGRHRAPQNWQNVNEVIADDDASYVYTKSTAYTDDLYYLPDSPELGLITNVTVFMRTRAYSPDPTQSGCSRTLIRTYDTNYYGTEHCQQAGPGWQTFSQEYSNNPHTGSPWTWDEINDLKAGVSLKTTGAEEQRATQSYVEVEHVQSSQLILRPQRTFFTSQLSTGGTSPQGQWTELGVFYYVTFDEGSIGYWRNSCVEQHWDMFPRFYDTMGNRYNWGVRYWHNCPLWERRQKAHILKNGSIIGDCISYTGTDTCPDPDYPYRLIYRWGSSPTALCCDDFMVNLTITAQDMSVVLD